MNSNQLNGMIWLKRGLLLGALLLAAGSVGAVERTLRIESPLKAVAGQPLKADIFASTDAGKGEQVGFLQAEYSVDDGKTWKAICYLQKSGPTIRQSAQLTPGAAGTNIKIRARAAFRDGLAGDVDHSGGAILWDGSWKQWKSPAAKHALITVTAR